MKKNVMIGLALFGTASMLCGFDNAETADSVLEKMNAAASEAESFSTELDFNLDAAIEVSDSETTSSLALTAEGAFTMAYTLDPFALQMDGDLSFSTLGMGQEMEMQMYAVSEDGSFNTYTFTKESDADPGAWTYSRSEDLNMSELLEKSKSLNISDYSEWGLDFTLTPEAVDVDGVECYELTAVIDSTDINTILDKSLELTGESLSSEERAVLDHAKEYLSGLKINMIYYADASSYLPVKAHIDLNDSDFSPLNDFLIDNFASFGASPEDTDIQLNLTDCSLNMTLSYEEVPEITVPQEALDAVSSGDAENLEDVVNDLGGITGTGSGE